MVRTALLTAMLLLTCMAARAADPLTIGSPAPKLELDDFLLGEPVKGLKKGTIYVIEFSGTQCAPCVKCIPELTALQKKNKEVVFVSVYSHERKETVADFVAKHREKMGYRVALDPDGAVYKAWADAALREGIPDAFVVADGRIAWVGNPAEMAQPLAQIVAGTFDPQVDVLRLKLQQGTTKRERLAAEREEKAQQAYERINAQVIKGDFVAALAATEAALKEYADAPNGRHLLGGVKLYLLAKLPGKKGAAAEYGVELGIAAKFSRNELHCRQLADFLLNAADDPMDRNVQLIDLAIVVLQDLDGSFDLYTRGRPKSIAQSYRISIYQQLGYAHHLRGNNRAAVRQLEEAIVLLKAREPEGDAEEFKRRQENQLASLTTDLARYKKQAERSPKEK